MQASRALLAGVLAAAIAGGSAAKAQLVTRTFVSSRGMDTSPCTRFSPCLTFARAITKTAASGEIDVIDPGSYGPVTITKSITIDGHGLGGITAETGAAVTVNAGTADVVVLRNLDLHGGGPDLGWGIVFNSGKQLIVDNVAIPRGS